MNQKYKIHFKETALWLAESKKVYANGKLVKPDKVYEFNPSMGREDYLKLLKNNGKPADIFLVNNNLDLLHDSFFSCFKVIQAGGGVVVNARREVLFIFRKRKWDLPKGKLEKNESVDFAAVREVTEETGAVVSRISMKIATTFHTYMESGTHFLKETHWYLMDDGGTIKLRPQKSEQIERAVWIPAIDLMKPLRNSYRSIADVIINLKKII